MQLRSMRRQRIGALLVAGAALAAWHAKPAAAQSVTYQVSFQGNWTTASTPGGVVAGGYFTTLIGGVHGSGVTFWEEGGTASVGVENVAELGSTGRFRSEVQASPHTLSVIRQGVSRGGRGSASFTISVTRTHPLVTLLSMIGPSPDWFVGVSGVSLLDGADQWHDELVVDLYPYDAGTEDGTEFTLSNPATDPQGVITSLRGTGKFSNVRMARLTFTLQAFEPEASFASARSSAGEGSGTRNVTVNLSPPPSTGLTLNYTLSGTATADSDYTVSGATGNSGTFTVASGATSVAVGVAITDDSADEGNETVVLTLTGGEGYTVGSPSAHTLTITDDDAPEPPLEARAVRLGASPNPVDEGGSVTVTAELSEALGSSVTIPLTLVPGTAEPSDYGSLESITIAGGDTRGTGTIPTAQDADEDDETFTVTLGTLPPEVRAGSPARVMVRIADDDGGPPPPNRPPTLSASCAPCEVAPGEEVLVAAEASDADGDDLTYAWSAAAGRFLGAVDGPTARWMAPAEAGRYGIRVEVSDGRGGSAGAEVEIEVSAANRPPAFGRPSYVFELEEGRAGPLELGRVDAQDPDGEALSYELASGDGERFRVGAADGLVSYEGEGEDFEAEPGSYALTVLAKDASGAEARAEVEVRITNVNEAPTANADAAQTPEDEPVEVDVRANDTDPEDDALRVESVSEPSHGTARVTAAGSVEYTPGADYHGADRFSYVVADPEGLTATGEVEVRVVAANDLPVAVGTIPEQTLEAGVAAAAVDLAVYFEDVDGDLLSFHATSSDTDVVGVAVAGSVVTVTPLAAGSAVVTVRAEDPDGGAATQTFGVTVHPDPLERGGARGDAGGDGAVAARERAYGGGPARPGERGRRGDPGDGARRAAREGGVVVGAQGGGPGMALHMEGPLARRRGRTERDGAVRRQRVRGGRGSF